MTDKNSSLPIGYVYHDIAGCFNSNAPDTYLAFDGIIRLNNDYPKLASHLIESGCAFINKETFTLPYKRDFYIKAS